VPVSFQTQIRFRIGTVTLQKTQIRELFLKERALRLPVPFPGHDGFKVSETALRRLVTVMTVLFLVTLAAAIASQLLESRNRQMADGADLTLLQADFTAQHLREQAQIAASENRTLTVFGTPELAKALSANAQKDGRRFLVVARSPPLCRTKTNLWDETLEMCWAHPISLQAKLIPTR
jgi:hypothetical protein